MKCKNCGQNLADGAKRCSSCGQDVNAPVNKTKVAVLVVTIILALCVVGIIIWAATRPADDTTTDPTGDTVQTTEGADATSSATEPTEYVPTAEDLINHPVLNRDSYTGEEGDTAALAATFGTVGDLSVTNGQFAIWYWQTYYDLLNQMGSYAAYYGLDTTLPLNEQTCSFSEVPMTWEQYLVESSIANWHSYMALYLEAVANDMTFSEEDQASLDTLEEDMLTTAQQYGYETVEEMLEADYGKGVTLDDYRAFVETLMLGNQYYSSQLDALEPTAEEVDEYYKENEASYAIYGILQDGTPSTINVRHILISSEESTTGDDADATEETVSEEELLEAARQEAQAILDQWKAGEATEDSFAALAKEFSTDPGSASNGGLYEEVNPGDMVTAFNDWCFDPERKPGDTGLVETDYGIHIMYFVSASETEYWYAEASAALISEMATTMVEETMAKYELNVDYSKSHLTPVNTTTSEY